MGSCTRRHFLLSTCFLQMITIIERQVFDFLGYMWAPIFVNFFHIIFIIFGFYGAYHFRIKYIITYLVWSFLWIGWNSFLICFYLNVGILDRDSDLLNLGTGSVSWFEVNGYGCKPTYPTNITSEDPYRPIRPERVDDCLLDYTLVEVIQSGVQCALALLGIVGAILLSYVFLDEDDRFDFMNGDAKSPQHTVVHPMYVSYSSIPTSASATMLPNKHHHQHNQQHNSQHHQQANNNNNTFLIHTNSSNSNKKGGGGGVGGSIGNTPNASMNNTLTKMLYQSKSNRIASSTTSIPGTPSSTKHHAPHHPPQPTHYYDDSTAKADQLFTNSNRRQMFAPATPGSSHDNTTSSLSYASLQSSQLNLAQSLRGGMVNPLSNSQYSLANSLNNNNTPVAPLNGTNNSGRFARIHAKPKPPKSTSYSSFINSSGGAATVGAGSNLHRPDIKYTQMSSERLSNYFEEGLEDDNFSIRNFKNDDAITYVPFQKPTPGNLFISPNNNPTYNSYHSHGLSPNNNSGFPRDNSQALLNGNELLLENNSVLVPLNNRQSVALTANNRIGLPMNPHYSPTPFHRINPTRPTNIPLPTIPQTHSFDSSISPSEVTPPPPPAPRPHIFQQRVGHAPYPDLSPEVTEKYAMPTQYVPRSPVASRIARRQRQQPPERSHLANTSANFCDQIRDAPPGYIDTGYNIVRAKSHDRLSLSHQAKPTLHEAKNNGAGGGNGGGGGGAVAAGGVASGLGNLESAPHVNRRSGRRESQGKARPRSYCNSMAGGEGVIRGTVLSNRVGASNGISAASNGTGGGENASYAGGGGGVRHVNKKSKHRQSLYSIEFGPSIDTLRSRTDTIILDYDDQLHEREGGELSPKPMTPRRVKRRSVMARGTNSRQSTTSRRSHAKSTTSAGGSSTGTHPRNSMRSSRRKYQQNPVTKLLDQQQQQLQQHQHQHHQHSQPAKQQFGSFHHKDNPTLTATNLQSLNQELISHTGSATNNILAAGVGSLTKTNNNHYHSFHKNIPPDPIYYNVNAQAGLFPPAWQSSSQSPIVSGGTDEPPTPTLTGHFNPTYQHSTTNLNDAEHVDELYNNRPPSVRSSYSNFHGTRPLSSYLSSSTTENVFAGLPGAAQQQSPTRPSTPPLYQQHPLHQHLHPPSQQAPSLSTAASAYTSTPPQNIPYAKSMAFLNSGPPAYNLNYHTPPDSETTM